ncbi:hypothetical protein HQ37_07490 [Porphyromonas sp. COT-239 OH1446]|nr:hypothetical protein HQ37_07490 [Porphyromonas sp. COT-239 OH1446]
MKLLLGSHLRSYLDLTFDPTWISVAILLRPRRSLYIAPSVGVRGEHSKGQAETKEGFGLRPSFCTFVLQR